MRLTGSIYKDYCFLFLYPLDAFCDNCEETDSSTTIIIIGITGGVALSIVVVAVAIVILMIINQRRRRRKLKYLRPLAKEFQISRTQ